MPARAAHAFLLLVSSISTWTVCVVYEFHGCMQLSYMFALKVKSGRSVFKVHRSFAVVVMASQACLVHLLCKMV
jgi:hypothetical protein